MAEIASVASKEGTENLLLVPHNPLKRDRRKCLKTGGGKESGKSHTVADRHGTGARASGGAESKSGIEVKKGTAIGSVAEKETAAEGGRARGKGERRRERDTGIKTRIRGETGRETGKETDQGILTEGTMTGTEGETVTESANATVNESETRDGTDPEAGNATETVGKTGAGTETGRGREIGTGTKTKTGTKTGTKTKTGIVGTGVEAEKKERRKRTVSMIHPRRMTKQHKMTRKCPSLCLINTTLWF